MAGKCLKRLASNRCSSESYPRKIGRNWQRYFLENRSVPEIDGRFAKAIVASAVGRPFRISRPDQGCFGQKLALCSPEVDETFARGIFDQVYLRLEFILRSADPKRKASIWRWELNDRLFGKGSGSEREKRN